MGFNNFKEMINTAQKLPKIKLSVAAADDREVLECIKLALENNIVEPLLVGSKQKIENFSKEISLDLSKVDIYDVPDTKQAAQEAVKLVSSKRADIIMKGMVGTSDFMKAVLNAEYGLRTAKLLSHLAAFDVPGFNRVVYMTDGGINITPDLSQKAQILQNAIDAVKAVGIKTPKAAVLAAVEVVNPNMETTLHAAVLSKMAARGQIKGALVDGPLALDNAINVEAAEHKGIKSPVAGQADILLVPNIESGNIFGKSLTYFARATMAGIVLGAATPIVLTSRADTAYAKLCSLVFASLVSKGIK